MVSPLQYRQVEWLEWDLVSSVENYLRGARGFR